MTKQIKTNNMRVHHLINAKVLIVNALVKAENNKGRTNISKNTLRMFAQYANELTHPKKQAI